MDKSGQIATIYNPYSGKSMAVRYTKSGSLLWDESTDAWTYHQGGPRTQVESIYQAIPAVFRGVGLIASSVGAMPFDILDEGGDVIDTSDDYQNALEWLPHPGRALGLTSQSLDLTGTCYWRRLANPGRYVKELRYQAPQTIEPDYDDNHSLIGFIRTANNRTEKLKVEDLLYLWLDDATVENQPPNAYPVKAALNAAGVLKNLDSYIIVYFERGAVRPVIATVPRGTPERERTRLSEWLTRLMSGLRGRRDWKVFEAEAIEFQQIGDGLEALQDNELTKEQRENVCAALGIPYSILFNISGGGLSGGSILSEDRLKLYDDTVVPRCKFIAGVWNEQLLGPLGYKLVFRPETLDIYQVDENERSESAARITQAIDANPKAFKFSSIVLGMELSPEAEALLDELIQEKEEAREQMADAFGGDGQPQDQEGESAEDEELPSTLPSQQATRAALVKWHRKALKAAKAGEFLGDLFYSEDIPERMSDDIVSRLVDSDGVNSVNAVFDWAFAQLRTNAGGDISAALLEVAKQLARVNAE